MPEQPPFSPTIALLTAARIAEAALTRVLEPHGLTPRKYGVLGHIAATPGLSLSELARRSGITVQSVHTLIGSLAEAGLVESVVEGTGRAARLTVTGQGATTLQQIATEVAGLDAHLFVGDLEPLVQPLLDLTRSRLAR